MLLANCMLLNYFDEACSCLLHTTASADALLLAHCDLISKLLSSSSNFYPCCPGDLSILHLDGSFFINIICFSGGNVYTVHGVSKVISDST